MTLTTKYRTIYTVGYTAGVNPRNEDRRAHGAVCHIQARKTAAGKILARKILVNGRYIETGIAFTPSAAEIHHWQSIAADH